MSNPLTAIDQLIALLAQHVDRAFSYHCKGLCPHESCLLAVIRAFRQGIVYGAKIRFPHALVMTVLFSKVHTSASDRVRFILRATYNHAKSLGQYAALYKLLTCLLRSLRRTDDWINTLAAGFVGGALTFGTNTAINAQINMYVMSRVILASLRLLTQRGIIPEWESTPYYAVYSGLVWASVMVLFEYSESTLQPSLASSMRYLYHDSDKMPKNVSPTQSFIEWIIAPVSD